MNGPASRPKPGKVRPSLAELTLASLRVGCLGFGGPAGQIALMQKIFVDEKKWLDEARFLHALNYCIVLPGPEAQQLATYVGWLMHGVRGGLIAGALFVLPGAVLVLALSWLYVAQIENPIVSAVFFGIKAAVLALVVEALVKVAKRALKTRLDLLSAVLAFGALLVLGAPFPLVILAAALVGLWRASLPPIAPADAQTALAQPSARGALSAALVWGLVWLAPLAASFVLLGADHPLSEVGALFAQLAVVTFGGAYAVLSYVQDQAVNVQGWLTTAMMVDGLGLAETTPGPLVLVNLFVGFMAGWPGGLGLAMACAVMAGWQTFAPSFVWIFAGAPYAERLRHSRFAQGALSAITAAVLGVIAQLALTFGVQVLFRQQEAFALPWGHQIQAPVLASADLAALAIALAAGVGLIRFKIGVITVILACALAGLLIKAM